MNYKNKIIAHRGIHNNKEIPENSMLSFKKALQEGIPIELDIRLTKDNNLIVFHDNNLYRMTKRNDFVKMKTLQEIKELYLLDTKEKIPTLKEVLDLVNNKVLLDIEIKTTNQNINLIRKLIEELDYYQGNFIIKSFNPRIIKILKRKRPNYQCGLLLTTYQKNIIYKTLTLFPLILVYYKPDFLAINKKMSTNKFIKFYEKNHKILLWTIKSKKELEKYKNTKSFFICDNLPYS